MQVQKMVRDNSNNGSDKSVHWERRNNNGAGHRYRSRSGNTGALATKLSSGTLSVRGLVKDRTGSGKIAGCVEAFLDARTQLNTPWDRAKCNWLDQIDYYVQLRKTAFSKELDQLRKPIIDAYVAEMRQKFDASYGQSRAQLEAKLAQVDSEWHMVHGDVHAKLEKLVEERRFLKRLSDTIVPPRSKRSQRLSPLTKEDRANCICPQPKGMSDTAWFEAIQKKMLGMNGTIKLLETEQKLLADEKNSVRKTFWPMVESHSRSNEFAYLEKCIRLMASQRAICFCLDIEAFETNQNVITEIGISIYDPRENMVPSMVPITKNYHLIIEESLELRNQKWVCDYKDCYLLGESYVLSLKECVHFIQSLINYYLVPVTEEDKTWSRAFVGHHVSGDLKWLETIGVKFPGRGYEGHLDHTLLLAETPGDLDVFILDTEQFYRKSYGEKGSSLGKILRLFEIPHAFLHNAGNDAYYTLHLFMKFCDINFRKISGMDDVLKVMGQVKVWGERDVREPKVVPMSYAISIEEAVKNRTYRKGVKSSRKERVCQTEFGGLTYFGTAKDAFTSTLPTH
ncbi:Gfd2p [Saccharomyces cerevisiae YJM1401]|nr:Gfd2p [Saccharomyces cerevisiae YJM1401]